MRRSENPEPSVGFCAVCGDRADGYHYGVLSCRGCNAFFRRAIAFNLQFHCRREGRCEINKNARCACRECRLKKCRDVGMDPSAVQVKREMKDVLALHQHHSHHQRRNVDADLSEPSISSLLSAHVYGSAKVLDSPTLKSRLLGSMSSSMAHSPQVMHPIDRLVEWYFCQYYRRMSMLCQTVEQILGAMNGQQEKLIAPATPEELIQVNKVQMVLMFEWVEQLEEFEQLEDPIEKTQLLRAFASKYLLLDTVMHTLEQGFTDRIVLPNGSYIHRNETPFLHSTISFDYGSNEEERRRHRAMKMLYEEDHLGLIEELIQPLADFEVTFSEFMALRLLLFWDSQELRNEPVQADLAEIIRHSSDRIVGDLQSWYEQQIPAVSEHGRLDNLLLFLPIIKKFSNHLSKITALIPDFSVMSEWQFIGDLVIGNSRS